MIKTKPKNSFASGEIMMLIFIIYTIAVKFIDVRVIGPEKTKVGFSTINKFVNRLIGFNNFWYKMSEFFGYLVIATAGIFVILAIVQLVKRKNIWKIDKNIISLGCFYVLIMFWYVLFEKLVINYRPYVFDHGLEASYPSSHTMLAICIMGSSIIQFRKRFRNKERRRCADIIAVFIGGLTVLGRTLSGVHWFSDIIGGIILSAAMLLLYNAIFNKIEKAQRRAYLNRQRLLRKKSDT